MASACGMTHSYAADRTGKLSLGGAGMEQVWEELLWALLPLWAAVFVGLLVGWSWRPRWVTLLLVALRTRPRLVWSIPPGFGARRLWLAATAATAAPTVRQVAAALQAWATRLRQHWELMQQKLRAFKAEEAASFFPAGRLTKRARRMLLKEAPSPGHGAGAGPCAPTPTSLLLLGTPSHARLVAGPADPIAALPALAAEQGAPTRPGVPEGPGVQRLQALELGPGAQETTAASQSTSSASSEEPAGRDGSLMPVTPSTSQLGSESHCDSPSCRRDSSCSHQAVLSGEDLQEFLERLEEKEGTERGGQAWCPLMEKRTGRMTYTAWRRDPQNGPTEYRSRTVVEECSPETMRDFFWEDDFRPEWDGMLAEWQTLEDCPATGLQIVRWVRKFPLFCKDREYIIGRRIWSEGSTYYCITKGLAHHPDAPRKDKPRRVDHFYSSWRIQSLPGGACEVLLFHQEDMGIQRDVAKMGVRQGMWGAVRKIEPGVRSFCRWQEGRGAPFSRSLSMARLHTPLADLAFPALERSSTTLCLRSRKWLSSCDLRQGAEGQGEGEGAWAEEGEREGTSTEEGAAGRGGDEAAGKGGTEDVAREGEWQEAAGQPEACSDIPGQRGRGAAVAGGEEGMEKLAARGEGVSAGAPGLSLVLAQATGTRLAQDTSGASNGSGALSEHREAAARMGHKKSPRHMRLFVAATAVAFVCGLETGVLVKLAVAGAIRHALCARGRNRGQ